MLCLLHQVTAYLYIMYKFTKTSPYNNKLKSQSKKKKPLKFENFPTPRQDDLVH